MASIRMQGVLLVQGISTGVIKLDDGEIVPNDLLQALADAKQEGGHTGMNRSMEG